MDRHDFLRGLHGSLRPRSYLEIGVNDGRGLATSSTRSIGVDPDFRINAELACDLKLVRKTSDDFFAAPDALDWFPARSVDLTFIDGMHLSEFALRDFINAERISTSTSVIIFDDMLPRRTEEAARDRKVREWAGDVFKVAAVLQARRPDLVVVPVDTEPTGLLLVTNLDPVSTVLQEAYDAVLPELQSIDPQQVHEDVLLRTTAADPQQLLDSPVWSELAAARDGAAPAAVTSLAMLRGTARYVPDPPEPEPWPPPNKTAKAAAKPAPKPAPKPPPKPPPPPPVPVSLTRRLRKGLARRIAG